VTQIKTRLVATGLMNKGFREADGLVSELMETSYRAGEVHGMEIADTMEHAQYLLKREK